MTARAVSSFLLPSRIPFVCLSVWRTAKLPQRLPNHGEHKLLPHQHAPPSSDSDERLQSDVGLSPAAEIHSGHIPICLFLCSGIPAPKPVRSSGIVSSDSAELLPPDCQMNHNLPNKMYPLPAQSVPLSLGITTVPLSLVPQPAHGHKMKRSSSSPLVYPITK